MRLASAAVTACVAVCLAASARAGDLVVVSNSTAIGFARGAVLADGTSVTIPAGQRLALIDVTGRGMVIRGPYQGPVHAPSTAASDTGGVLTTVKSILTSGALTSGVARAAGGEPQPPDPRLLDISADATVCVAAGGGVRLWRPTPTKRTTLFVTRLATGERAELPWPANEATAPWPDTLRIADGESYQFALQGVVAKPRLAIKLEPPEPLAVASAKRLADAGCLGQAVTMLEAIAAAGAR